MPMFERDGAAIYYEEYGQDFPILTFAPGGLRSTIEQWRGALAPINPMTEFADRYRVIVMDQRNATGGRSRAPITASDNWSTYTADHIALLDHLGIDRCHLYGQCIGGPFIMSFLKAQPQRVICAVPAQPSGRVGPAKPGWSTSFENWVKGLEGHPEATKEVLDAVYRNMYGPDFLYSVSRDFLPTCKTPCLVLAGNDANHPFPVSEDMSRLLPDVEFIVEWKSGEPLEAAKARIKAFLARYTPA